MDPVSLSRMATDGQGGDGGAPGGDGDAPATDFERRLRDAGSEELLALVRERAAELSPVAARQALLNPFVNAEVIEALAAQARLLAFYEVKRDLARCRATPDVL